MSRVAGRPTTRAQFDGGYVWETTIRGARWWGNGYMAIKSEPFWDDLSFLDIALTLRDRGAHFKRRLAGFATEHRRGETIALRLSEPFSYVDSGIAPYPVRLGISARNGHRVLGSKLLPDGRSRGPALINAGFAKLIEARLGRGEWFLAANRMTFLYVVGGKVLAVVMSISPSVNFEAVP